MGAFFYKNKKHQNPTVSIDNFPLRDHTLALGIRWTAVTYLVRLS